jgi:hypothetical protein
VFSRCEEELQLVAATCARENNPIGAGIFGAGEAALPSLRPVTLAPFSGR